MAPAPKQQSKLMVGEQSLEDVLKQDFADFTDFRKASRVMAAAKVWADACSSTDVAALLSSKASAEAVVETLKARRASITIRDHCHNMLALLKVLRSQQPPLLQLDAAVAAEIEAVLIAAKEEAASAYAAEKKAAKAAQPNNEDELAPAEEEQENEAEEEAEEAVGELLADMAALHAPSAEHAAAPAPAVAAAPASPADPADPAAPAAGWTATDEASYSSLKQLIETAVKDSPPNSSSKGQLMPLLAKLYKARALLKTLPAEHAKLLAFRSAAADMQLGITLLIEAEGAEGKAELMETMQAELAALLEAALQG